MRVLCLAIEATDLPVVPGWLGLWHMVSGDGVYRDDRRLLLWLEARPKCG